MDNNKIYDKLKMRIAISKIYEEDIAMKKFILLLVVCFIGVRYAKAQYVAFPTVNCYDTELTNLHLNVVREMSQRTAIISQTVNHIESVCINTIKKESIEML